MSINDPSTFLPEQKSWNSYQTLVDATNNIQFKTPGLEVYIIDEDSFYYWEGSTWTQRSNENSLTSSIINDEFTSGLLTGGVLTLTGGIGFQISAGEGYIKDGINPIKKITWPTLIGNTTINGRNFIAINDDGTGVGEIIILASEDVNNQYIEVGAIITSIGNTVVVGFSSLPKLNINNFQLKIANFTSNAIGALVENGLNLAEQVNPNFLKVTMGSGYANINLQSYFLDDNSTFTKIIKTSNLGNIPETSTTPNEVTIGYWNDPTQPAVSALVAMTSGYWKKDVFFTTIEGNLFYVYGQAEYATEEEARLGPIPEIENDLRGGIITLAAIVTNDTSTSIADGIIDIRPFLKRLFDFGSNTSPSSVVNHSDLTGLSNDDHPQYHTDSRGDARYVKLTGGAISGLLLANGGIDVTDNGINDTLNIATTNADFINFGRVGAVLNIYEPILNNPKIVLGSDATGDIYYRNSGGSITRLGIGTSSQFLKGGTTPSYGAILNSDLPNSGVVADTYNNVTVNSKGIITSGSNVSYLTSNQTITLSGDITGSGTTAITTTIANGAVTNAKITSVAWSKITGTPTNLSGYGITDALSTTLITGRIIIGNGSNIATTVAMSGDATLASSGVLTLATVNSNIGTFNNVTVNGKGLITAASNVSYLTSNQTITLSGDISGSGTTAITTTIANNAVTFAKFQNISTNRILGRGTAGTGNIEELIVSTGLEISAGNLSVDATIVTLNGVQTLTNKTISGSSNTISNIGNSSLTNSTISGVSLGSNLFALTIGTGLIGTSYNGSSAVSITIDSTVATLTGSQILTNKTLTSARYNQLNDTNGNKSVGIVAITSAVNYLDIYNGGTGTSPKIISAGSDTNINLNLESKGTTGTINFQIGSNYLISLPTTAPTTNQVLRYNGSAYVWATVNNTQWTTVDATNIYFAGEIGIGAGFPSPQTTPTDSIHIDNGTNVSSALKFTAGSNTANGTRLGIDGQGNCFLSVRDNKSLTLSTNDTARLFIDNNGKIGIGTTSVDASALLDLVSTAGGLGLPSMTATQRNAISSPRNGLVVNQTDSIAAIYGRINNTWKDISSIYRSYQFSLLGSAIGTIGYFTKASDIAANTSNPSGAPTTTGGSPGVNNGVIDPYMVINNATVTTLKIKVVGAAVDAGSVGLPTVRIRLYRVDYSSRTQLGTDIDIPISATGVGIFNNASASAFQTAAITTLNISVNAGDLIGIEFVNQTGVNGISAISRMFAVLETTE